MRLPLALLLALAVPLAAAQDEADPDLNETDMDTEAPPADESYLDEDADASAASTDEPALDEAQMDASLPPADDAWLAEEEEAQVAASDDEAPASEPMRTPGPGVALVLASLAGLALALRR